MEHSPRFKTKNNICKECFAFSSHCNDAKACVGARKELPSFCGVRLTADGFDCALPVTIDSHNKCSYNCLYCFSENITGHQFESGNTLKQTSLKFIEGIFSGQGGQKAELFRKALKYDKKRNGFPCPVQLGGLCDAGDNIERNQGWLIEFINIAII